MASLKTIKDRIHSIKSTLKITSAMKMIASAKLHKAQNVISSMSLYSESLNGVINELLSACEVSSVFCESRPVKKVALIVFTSDSTLCGAFNSNTIRELHKTLQAYEGHTDQISLYTIGKKGYEAAQKWGIPVTETYEKLSDKPDYSLIAVLAEKLMKQYEEGIIDQAELIYHQFKSTGIQILTHRNLLPLTLKHSQTDAYTPKEFLFEPSPESLLKVLIPKCIKLQLYTALLDSNASEHAIRMIAMQSASDNANELISDLTVEYNKSRQQAITNELLDIIGGSMKRKS